MKSIFQKLIVLLLLAFVVSTEFGSLEEDPDKNQEFDAKKEKEENKEKKKEESKEKNKEEKEEGQKAKASEKTRGALGQGFEVHKIDLLSKQLQATGSKIFKSLPHDKCTVTDKLGTTQRDDSFYSSTESLYQSVSSNTKVSASLKGAYTLGVSVSAVTNNIVSGNTEISGLSLNLKAYSMSHALKQDCINKRPLAKELVDDFEKLDKKISKSWLSQSWRKYKVFLQKYGSHIVKETISGASIYQYVFAKSSEKFTQKDFSVKACVSLAGPTQYGKVGVSACSGVDKKDIEESKDKSMVKKLVVRGGKSDTRADLTGELSQEQINKFLKEGQSDPSPIQYSFYPIWTILKARYIGKEHFAQAVNLEQFYKGFLHFGCTYEKTSNDKELQKFDLSGDSDPEAPTYVCKIAPEGCRVDDDCHYEHAFWCSCSGESCVRYKDSKLNSGQTKRVAYAYTADGWGWHGCDRSGFTCNCDDPGKNWQESWSGNTDAALSDINAILASERRNKTKRHHV